MDEKPGPEFFKGRTCFLALPLYYNIEPETAQAAYDSAGRHGVSVCIKRCTTSVLPFGFNILWSEFLNHMEWYDYFCMLHSDVHPWFYAQDRDDHSVNFWLNILIEELEKGGYDAMHAVCAIKDERGLTSTGIGSLDDRWGLVRKITVTELQQLPQPFGFSDVMDLFGGDGFEPSSPLALLPNTGCLLVKNDRRWRRFPGFQISSRLRVTDLDGVIRPVDDATPESVLMESEVTADSISEDWNFGFWCADHGMRVGGTARVKVNHWGKACFPTTHGWGRPTDEEFLRNNKHKQLEVATNG